MAEDPSTPEPPRLGEKGGSAGRLIEAADPAFRRGLNEAAAWQSSERRQQRRIAICVGRATCAVGATVAVVGLRSRVDREDLAPSREPIAARAPENRADPPRELTPAPPEPSALVEARPLPRAALAKQTVNP